MKNIYDADDYSRRTGSVLSRTLAKLRNPFLSTYALLKKSPPVWNLLNKPGKMLYQEKNMEDFYLKKIETLEEDLIVE